MSLTKVTNSMISGATVNVFDYIPPEEHAAILDGTTTYDCTPAFILAINYVRSLSISNTGGGSFPPKTVNDFFQTKAALTGPNAATFCFSDSIVTPTLGTLNISTDYKNFDMLFEGCTFKALSTYNHANSLIHVRGMFDYEFKGITFFGFNTSYPIFIDQHDANHNKGLAKYTTLTFENCDYGIRHEFESCVAVVSGCLTDFVIKTFLFVSRCDQMKVADSSFEWLQNDLADYDGFIMFGVDQYADPANPQTPGLGTYTVGRLLVDNCMFIPVGNGLTAPKSAWINNVSGSVVVRACHFGPECLNRPIIVLTSSPAAFYGVASSLVDTFIVIENSSCVTSYSLIYCLNDYPNKIDIRNIRYFNQDYGNPAGSVRYALSGASALNNLTSKYRPSDSVFFNYNINIFVPQSTSGFVPIDPRLYWPRYVTTFNEIAYGDNSNVNLTNQALATFIISDPEGVIENFDSAGGLYSVSFTGDTKNTSTAAVGTASYSGYVEVSIVGNTMTCTWYEVYQSAFGASSGISAQFYNLTANTVSPTLSKTTLLSDPTNYALYMGFFAPATNEWTSARIKFKRIT